MHSSSIVELTGLPGAGKTTIVNILASEEEGQVFIHYRDYRNLVKKNKIEKLAFMKFLIPRFVRLTWLSYKVLTLCNNKKSVAKRIRKLYVILFYLHQFQKDKSGKILLMDQGVMQMIISAFVFGSADKVSKLPELLNKFIRVAGITGKYVIIYLKVPVEVAIDRIDKRPKNSCEYKSMGIDFREMRLRQYDYALEFSEADLVCSALESSEFNAQKIKKFYFE